MCFILLMLDIDRSERERLADVYAEHGQFLFKAAMLQLGNIADAQTAVLDTIISIRGCEIPAEKEDYVRAYLLAVLEHQMQKLQTEMRKHASISFEDWMCTTSTDPEQQLLQSERYELIKAYIQQMPDKDKNILLLAEFNTPQQISEILGLSITTVYKRLQRARGRLRDICRKEGWLDD